MTSAKEIGIGRAVLQTDRGVLVGPEGQIVPVPRSQQVLLLALASRIGRPVSYEALLDALWGGRDDGPSEEGLKVFMWHVRRKLEGAGAGISIENFRRFGYQLGDAPSALPRVLSGRQSELIEEILAAVQSVAPRIAHEFREAAP